MADYISNFLGNEIDTILQESKNHYDLTNSNPHNTKSVFFAKWRMEGINKSIGIGVTYNLLKTLNLVTNKIYIGNIEDNNFSLVNQGLDNALIKLPNYNQLVNYTIAIRLEGTIGGGSSPAELYVNLKRADNSIVNSKDIIKNLSTSLNKKEMVFETASYNSNDNYIQTGIKFELENPTQNGSTITLNAVELLIKGSK